MGVLTILIENDLLPNWIAGSSSGSLIAVLVGSNSKAELIELIRDDFR